MSDVRCPFNDVPCGHHASDQIGRFGRTLRALSDSNAALARATDELKLLQAVCKIIVKDCGHAMVWIGYAEEDPGKTVRPMAQAGFEKGYIESLKITWADSARGRGPTGTAIRTGKPCLCRNILTDPSFKPWRAQARRQGYASSLVLPLLSDGRVFGVINIYSRHPDPFSEDEVNLLAELAGNLAYGIATLRLRLAHAETNQALIESESRYRSLFNGMFEGFSLQEIVCDEQGAPSDFIFLEVNPAFERLTGLKRDELIGRTVLEVIPGTERVWIEKLGRVALTGRPARFEEFSAALGKYFDVYAYRPAPSRVAALIVDTTERRLTEERIWHAASFPHLNPHPVLEVDRDGRIAFHNPAAATIAANLGAADVLAFLPADIEEILASPLDQPLYREVEIAGRIFGETVCAAPGFDAVRIFSMDVTEQKRMERELRESKAALERAQTIGNIGNWRLDVRTDELIWSDQVHRIFGVPQETPLSYDLFLQLVHPDDREAVDRCWQASLKGGDYDIEHRIIVQGAIKWVREKAFLEFDEQGGLLAGFGITQDITARKDAEIELRRRAEELARAVAAKNELLGVAAHDLRNPLFVLSGFCELILRRAAENTPRPIVPFIEKIHRQVRYMSKLVDDLMDLSSFEAGQLILRPEPTDLTALLDEIVVLQRELAAAKNIDIECRIDEALPRLVLDRNKMEQVVNNLIANAVKFSHRNSTITVDARLMGGPMNRVIVCTVRDRGVGIPRAKLDQIFKPFFTGQAQGTAGEKGFGLGLAIVQKIVKAHDGELVVESEEGCGSVFKLVLPVRRDENSAPL